MKRLAAALIGLALVCAVPASALSVSDYSPAEMRKMEASARAGDVDAMLQLGKAHAWGRSPGNGTDRASAVYWLHKAANLGNAEAQRELGNIYNTWDGPRDETRAILWYVRAAEKGDVLAQGQLANLYETSKTRSNYAKGYHWTLKAALQGDDNAVVRLQTLYVHKDAVTSFDAALEKLSDAADRGDADAQWQLATILMVVMTGHEDPARARALAEKAAAQNSPEGMRALAFLIRADDTLSEEAVVPARVALLRKAADLGHVPAQLDWMTYYESPLHFTEIANDPVERLIFDWLTAAAEKGWPMAQSALPHYYDRGLFVAQDSAESHKWLLLSRHLPYHRNGFWGVSSDPWRQDGDNAMQAEGRQRAEAWLKAHPRLYWQGEE